jgi:hypothetical protein
MSISAVVHLVHVVVSGDYQAIVHRMSLFTHTNLRQEGQFVCANQLNGLQILRDLLCVVRMLKIHYRVCVKLICMSIKARYLVCVYSQSLFKLIDWFET